MTARLSTTATDKRILPRIVASHLLHPFKTKKEDQPPCTELTKTWNDLDKGACIRILVVPNCLVCEWRPHAPWLCNTAR